ncbi:hypothetical protein D3C86_2000210 [compost metagenome]
MIKELLRCGCDRDGITLDFNLSDSLNFETNTLQREHRLVWLHIKTREHHRDRFIALKTGDYERSTALHDSFAT